MRPILFFAFISACPTTAFSDFLFVSSADNATVFQIDTSSGNVVSSIVDPGFLVQPRGLALNSSHTQIHVASPGSNFASLRYDIATSQRIDGVVNTGVTSVSRGLDLTADGTKLYIASTTGAISVRDFTQGTTNTVIRGLSNPLGIQLSSDEASIFVANSGANSVVERSLSDGATLRTFDSPNRLTADVEFTRDRSLMYVSTFGDSGNGAILPAILTFDVLTGQLVSTWSDPSFNGDYYGLALSGDENRLFVSDFANSRILQFDTGTGLASELLTGANLSSPTFLAIHAVPEPSSLLLVTLLGSTLAFYRTRHLSRSCL
ncbi:MAG: PEP-CTERM sorting domain-containing protein [Pirellulaceae bacterium]